MAGELVQLDTHGDVSIVTMTNDENRWTTALTREFDAVLDEVEATAGPSALVTASANPKFFSNGLDLGWITSKGEHPGGDRKAFNDEVMALFARLITFPMPTVCAIGGHAFGAGLMIALCHDRRVMREDRGYLCANEVELGFAIPDPELALFRHKVPMPAFYETVQLARRWSGPEALDAGMVNQIVAAEGVVPSAVAMAQELAHLGANREVFGWMKEHIFGEEAAINGAHGAAHMLRNQRDYGSGPGTVPSPADL